MLILDPTELLIAASKAALPEDNPGTRAIATEEELAPCAWYFTVALETERRAFLSRCTTRSTEMPVERVRCVWTNWATLEQLTRADFAVSNALVKRRNDRGRNMPQHDFTTATWLATSHVPFVLKRTRKTTSARCPSVLLLLTLG